MARQTLGLLALVVASCGGDGGGDNAPAPSPSPPPPITDANRISAATLTINNNAMCSAAALGPYYWEIGDASGLKASGSVGQGAPTAATSMLVYSASKWLYAASIVEQRAAAGLDPVNDVPYLNFTSGWSKFGNQPFCLVAPGNASVDNCPPGSTTNAHDPSTDGRFAYDTGHMQHHASAVMGLGAANTSQLEFRLNQYVGNFGYTYNVPQLAAGVQATTLAYAHFLQLLLQGKLLMSARLGTHKVCAQTQAPGCNAAFTPDSIGTEAWNYSLGHWVEDDPTVGDHAFSSPGGGGFYPWIDATKTYYGILARDRQTESGAGFHSAQCGRLVRQAWVTGKQVTSDVPTPGP
jgi:hypothetical protein